MLLERLDRTRLFGVMQLITAIESSILVIFTSDHNKQEHETLLPKPQVTRFYPLRLDSRDYLLAELFIYLDSVYFSRMAF